ncbi:MAG: phosphatase PAP2 family protein [Patescibacteria group bacterium]|nr:phosphatase PAP2 family protein [Patescibacteria group bacterium]
MNTVIALGAEYLYIPIALLAVYLLWLEGKGKRKSIIVFAVISLPLTLAIARITGHFYYDPRPFVVGHFAPIVPHAPDNGFPSDHALLASALAALVFVFNKRNGIIIGVLALLVGYFRVASGVHHWIDIAGSFVISAFTATLVYFILRDFYKKRAPALKDKD